MDMKVRILNSTILKNMLHSQHYDQDNEEGIDTSMYDELL
jgi:hypothetical protein